jgi:dTDP-4-amino-4,6-dideoxygalactose transaminase
MEHVPMLDLRAEYEHMNEDINSAITTCLSHQQWIFGPEIKELEDKIASYLDVKHCIGVSSGTDALVLSLRALAIQLKGQEYFDEKDEIITTPFTFTATGDAILRAGATPVFVDINSRTYNIDPSKVQEYLSTNASRVVGILPVHLYGQTCEMNEIMNIATKHNLFVLEDVAQAFGAQWKDKKAGSIGHAGAFSFFPSKNLGGYGDGGMVSTNDSKTAEIIKMLLKHGGKDKYNVDHLGYNARLDTLQAAILLVKLRYIDEFNGRRREIARKYTEELSDIEELTLPVHSSHVKTAKLVHDLDHDGHVFHQYTVRSSRRAELQEYLKGQGVSTMIYYPHPLHKMKVFERRMKISGQLLNVEKAAEEVLSIPIGPFQKDSETARVIASIKQFREHFVKK